MRSGGPGPLGVSGGRAVAATKTEPTDEQIRAYADKLPGIYREVLAAFPSEAPNRRLGDGLLLSSIDARFQETMPPDYRTRDLNSAVSQLEARGFLARGDRAKRDGLPGHGLGVGHMMAQALRTLESDPFLVPTYLGERLITAVTGHSAAEKEVPPLPEPTWG